MFSEYYNYIIFDHKTSQKGLFLIEIYMSSESWINHISIDVWFVMIRKYFKIWNLRVQKKIFFEEISFKVVQMKFLSMHINNQKLTFDIFMVVNLLNIFMKHDLNILMIFGIKEKCVILSHSMYCCLLLHIYLCCLWLLLCSRDTFLNLLWTFIKTYSIFTNVCSWALMFRKHYVLSFWCNFNITF